MDDTVNASGSSVAELRSRPRNFNPNPGENPETWIHMKAETNPHPTVRFGRVSLNSKTKEPASNLATAQTVVGKRQCPFRASCASGANRRSPNFINGEETMVWTIPTAPASVLRKLLENRVVEMQIVRMPRALDTDWQSVNDFTQPVATRLNSYPNYFTCQVTRFVPGHGAKDGINFGIIQNVCHAISG